jgi:hypothetical protein
MIVCDTLEAVCNGKPLEDRFFDIFADCTVENGGEI